MPIWFIMPSRPFIFPLDIWFIIFLDSLNCLIKRFTSAKGRAEPAAIRLRRACDKISGFSRSCGVIDKTIAFIRAVSFGSTFKSFRPAILFNPGIIFKISSSGPILFTWSNWSIKSLKSKVLALILSAISCALASSKSCCAFSIRVIISPIPRIREAIRSG